MWKYLRECSPKPWTSWTMPCGAQAGTYTQPTTVSRPFEEGKVISCSIGSSLVRGLHPPYADIRSIVLLSQPLRAIRRAPSRRPERSGA